MQHGPSRDVSMSEEDRRSFGLMKRRRSSRLFSKDSMKSPLVRNRMSGVTKQWETPLMRCASKRSLRHAEGERFVCVSAGRDSCPDVKRFLCGETCQKLFLFCGRAERLEDPSTGRMVFSRAKERRRLLPEGSRMSSGLSCEECCSGVLPKLHFLELVQKLGGVSLDVRQDMVETMRKVRLFWPSDHLYGCE
jgi:hypothetical protein